MCDHVAASFSLITGTSCSASIKIITWDEDKEKNTKLKAITFCRDRHSAKRRENEKPDTKHWLDENTDFIAILSNIESPGGRYFFSNQLPFLSDYKNTSFGLYSTPYAGQVPLFKDIIRAWKWPLPYKSCIVVPICPSYSRKMSNLVGFLCIDAGKIGAFKKEYDVDLLSGVADGIYNVMKNVSLRESEYIPSHQGEGNEKSRLVQPPKRKTRRGRA